MNKLWKSDVSRLNRGSEGSITQQPDKIPEGVFILVELSVKT